MAATLSPVVIVKPITNGGYKVVCNDDACKLSLNPIAKQIYKTIKKVQEFFLETFNHRGLDGKGKMVPVVIEWDKKNAEWMCQAGTCLMRFHNIYALTPEVVAHEYMHGVIDNVNPLEYYKQSGALNESLADVMGIAFKRWSTGKIDWKIGDLRNLEEHSTMENYVKTKEDAGGVHTNSAIPNHAFFCAAKNSGCLRVIAKIWFAAFQKISHTASFKEFALKTVEIAKSTKLDSVVVSILRAWSHVGVLQTKVKEKVTESFDKQSGELVVVTQTEYSYR